MRKVVDNVCVTWPSNKVHICLNIENDTKHDIVGMNTKCFNGGWIGIECYFSLPSTGTGSLNQ